MQRRFLTEIVDRKKREVDALLASPSHVLDPLYQIYQETRQSPGLFARALRGPQLAIISEIKRRSPSCGEMNAIADPAELAKAYCRGGASAISVLTDKEGFGGSLEDLKRVSHEISPVPTLRKDFIVHPLQLAEAAMNGASAVLLIVKTLQKDLEFFLKESQRLGLDALTEVHDRKDLEIALEAEAPIIGINHRNLETFSMDLDLSKELRPLIPSSVIAVAESGIHDAEQARRMRELGFDAVLVGEALVRSCDPADLIQKMRGFL